MLELWLAPCLAFGAELEAVEALGPGRSADGLVEGPEAPTEAMTASKVAALELLPDAIELGNGVLSPIPVFAGLEVELPACKLSAGAVVAADALVPAESEGPVTFEDRGVVTDDETAAEDPVAGISPTFDIIGELPELTVTVTVYSLVTVVVACPQPVGRAAVAGEFASREDAGTDDRG